MNHETETGRLLKVAEVNHCQFRLPGRPYMALLQHLGLWNHSSLLLNKKNRVYLSLLIVIQGPLMENEYVADVCKTGFACLVNCDILMTTQSQRNNNEI
ncbi:hypothetical protein chiPu_0008650 [Chiloscyllium punctatum]|uniref:Uncharacterized protein n=1 Tax=Chiloscyllium punctatum TaxID=137246 RepID=A0A401SIH1_CHIPU|nr:hypothetical protein [Chiloscyllium punctatum]